MLSLVMAYRSFGRFRQARHPPRYAAFLRPPSPSFGHSSRAARIILPQGASWYADDQDKVQRGGVIGMVELVDCVEAHPSPWFQGPYGFVLRHVKPTPFYPCRGRLGLFVPEGWSDATSLKHEHRQDLSAAEAMTTAHTVTTPEGYGR